MTGGKILKINVSKKSDEDDHVMFPTILRPQVRDEKLFYRDTIYQADKVIRKQVSLILPDRNLLHIFSLRFTQIPNTQAMSCNFSDFCNEFWILPARNISQIFSLLLL